LTLVVKQHPGLPAGISANATIGVRIPDHALARRLLRMAGPLAISSANLSGYPSPRTAQEVFEQLDGRIAMILDGGRTSGGIPSTVVDCLTSVPKIIRAGPISEEDILAALNMKQ
jgi:L-threonylcarbamoyladenylate synthase